MKKVKKRVAKKVVKRVVPDSKARAWAKRNPWFGKDALATAFALGVHERLVTRSVDPKADEYYAAIDRRMQRFWEEEKLFPLKNKKQRQLLIEQGRELQLGWLEKLLGQQGEKK